MNQKGAKTRHGTHWVKSEIQVILRNYTYTGNLILQETYRKNYISKKIKINNGEHAKNLVEDNDEAIIDLNTFITVQDEIRRRNANTISIDNSYPLTGMLECSRCGNSYKRRINKGIPCSICRRFVTLVKIDANQNQYMRIQSIKQLMRF